MMRYIGVTSFISIILIPSIWAQKPTTLRGAVRPGTSVSVERAQTVVSVTHPTSTTVVQKPVTTQEVSHPQTQVAVSHPSTTTRVTYPQTTVQVVHPQTTVQVIHPQTTVVVSHPATLEGGNRSASFGSGGVVGGKSTPTTSMSNFQPKQAKDLTAGTANKAPNSEKAAPVGGGNLKLGNETDESSKDSAASSSTLRMEQSKPMNVEPERSQADLDSLKLNVSQAIRGSK